MTAKRFSPSIDALDCPEGLLGSAEALSLRQGLDRTVAEALGVLRAEFSGMVDYYDLPRRMRLWQDVSQIDGWQTTAAAVGSVDLFLARRPPPGVDGPRAWREFLRQRTLAALAVDSVRLAQWRAILHGIPEQWLPQEVLRRSLHQQLAADGRFTYLDLQLMLRLPTPGGRAWLRAASLREWRTLREQLALGRPCLVELVRDQPTPDLLQRETVVVYEGAEPAADLVVFHAYHPRHGARALRFQVDFAAEELCGREEEGADASPLRGFFLLDCRAQTPPQDWRWRLARAVGIAQLAWRWRHRPRRPRGDKAAPIC